MLYETLLKTFVIIIRKVGTIMKQAITFLGRDSGFGKKNTSAYAMIDKRLLLIDCGQTVMRQLQKKNLLNNISGIDVIITHMHGDHVGSLSQLALYSYFTLRKPINIITACSKIEEFLTITGVDRYCQIPGFPEERYTRNNNFVTFIKTNHVGNEMDCYGFSTKINGIHIVYTGDTTTIEPFMHELTQGTQLFCDASTVGGVHLKLQDNIGLLNELTKKGVSVYLMHLDNEPKIRKMIRGTKIHICGRFQKEITSPFVTLIQKII